ncbi:MAG: hypothetical protein AAFX56_16470 [Pseudomonadota bacterium]
MALENSTVPVLETGSKTHADVTGEFVDLLGERYYAVRNVDRMPPFFTSVTSNDDHWLFVSSTGGLTAGRVSPETALFPYVTVDKIHDSATHTGSLTLLRVLIDETWHDWDPFGTTQNGRYRKTRNLYKNVLGNKLCFEEINHDLALAFRYTWMTSDRHGFVRDCELVNLGTRTVSVEVLDGLQNILPAGTPRFAQTNTSNLVDAYKWTEFDANSGLALFTLYSGITDRAEPSESLKANVAYCLGLDKPGVLICSEQLQRFRRGLELREEALRRGIRGAFIVNTALRLAANASKAWQIVVNTEQTQAEVVALRSELATPDLLGEAVRQSIAGGSDKLARIMASGDAFQATAEEAVTAHHYANVLFNILRGGVFFDQYRISARDLRQTIKSFNSAVYERNRCMLDGLPELLTADALLATVRKSGDRQLQRLCREYLPITFGRRHGDPSRPWNQFAIRLRDAQGNALLSYAGNWRDIFQNWEALAFSFPEFVESMIAKFVSASTADGYNPYRITKEGIDWEVEDPEDPWSYIGYWGDHQIIYLQKLLEQSIRFHPQRLSELLHLPVFSYANVPYRIRPFTALLEDPKSTVDYDEDLAERIEQRLETLGADGKLLLDAGGQVYQVNLLEKLLVPLLCKLCNLVIDGGIWMNTQRPEWNDANNALVGQGLSMVTLYYLRRHIRFLEELLADENGGAEISAEVAQWLAETGTALARVAPLLGAGPVSPAERLESMTELGEAASRYRETVYRQEGFSGKVDLPVGSIRAMLTNALIAIDHCIASNRREDGLYHAYNLLEQKNHGIHIERLYAMLEGQVSVLSSGSISGEEAVGVLDALFESSVYRADQESFMLYPDRELPTFLEKNRIPPQQIDAIPLLRRLFDAGDTSVVLRDADGHYRFNPEFINRGGLQARLDELDASYSEDVAAAREAVSELYEEVFNHQAFTGRSGTMFGFEGLGCVYWHMVSKLLLAVQENFFLAADANANAATLERLGALYYRVRQGIGFNKTPTEFGAFPTDPYSHTPKHSGARQPGMTGQVKEEILTRFGELGVQVSAGAVRFVPRLLRRREFVTEPRSLPYLDVEGQWQQIEVPREGLAFTWCQVPIVYTLGAAAAPAIAITLDEGQTPALASLELPAEYCAEIFGRSGRIRRLDVSLPRDLLFSE